MQQETVVGMPSERASRREQRAALQAHAGEDALLRIEAVQARTGMGRSYLYLLVKRGEFPAPVKIGSRCARWRSRDVAAWIAAKGAEA